MNLTSQSRTKFATFEEPNPLAAAGPNATAASLSSDVLLRRIDQVLRSSDALNLVQVAEPMRTRIRDELDPLAAPTWGGPRDATISSRQTLRQLEVSLSELRSWLSVGLDVVTRAVGISRGTVYAWRKRSSEPRAATVSSILRLHSLVSSAVAVAGVERTRQFFHAGSPSPLDRLVETHGDAGVLSEVGREVRRRLTGATLPPPNPLLTATVDDIPLDSLG